MGAAVALRDVVGEAEHVFVIGIVPFQRDVDADAVAFRTDRDRIGQQRLLVAVEIFDEGRDPAFVKQIVLDHFVVALVAQQDTHARIEECEFAVAMLQLLEIEFGDVLEGVGRGQEGDARALLGLAVGVSGASPFSISGATASPCSNRIQCSMPSRQMVSSSHSDSAFTTETPTPCRPPETL